jgi:hypothetical protein
MTRESGPFPFRIRGAAASLYEAPPATRQTLSPLAQSAYAGPRKVILMGSGDALELIGCLGVNCIIATGNSWPIPAGRGAEMPAAKRPFALRIA